MCVCPCVRTHERVNERLLVRSKSLVRKVCLAFPSQKGENVARSAVHFPRTEKEHVMKTFHVVIRGLTVDL